ncbi:MAG: hypothetical protein AB7J34_13125 [Limisphaerales bacterium]
MGRRLGILGLLGAAAGLWTACGFGVPPAATLPNPPPLMRSMELLPIGASDKPLPRVVVVTVDAAENTSPSDEPRIVAVLRDPDFDRMDRRIQDLSRSETPGDLERADFGSYEVQFAEATGRQPRILDPPASRTILTEIRAGLVNKDMNVRFDHLLRRLGGEATSGSPNP